MMRRRPHRNGGFTVVEMMTVVLLIVIVAGLVLLGLAGARRAAQKAACLSNMRQLGMAFSRYVSQTGALPSIHTNIWAIAGDQMALRGIMASGDQAFANNRNDLIPDLYRCPEDAFRQSSTQACSYAPNCEDAPHDRPTGPGGADERNWRYSPWSTYKLDAAMQPVPSPNRFLRNRAPDDAAVDTILLIECWNSANMIDVTGYRNAPIAPINNYEGPAAAPQLDDGADAGTYTLLRSFADRAAAGGRSTGVASGVCHGGTIGVLFADGHTDSYEAIMLTQRSPKDIGQWTRAAD